MKVIAMIYETHKLYQESHSVSRLRENLTSGSDGEGGNEDNGTAPAFHPTVSSDLFLSSLSLNFSYPKKRQSPAENFKKKHYTRCVLDNGNL